MHPKYQYKSVILPKATGELVARVQEQLTQKLGFKPSFSETIAAAASAMDKHNATSRALASLVAGVEELQAAWPKLGLPSEGLHNDLIGFLFATLPIAQDALKRSQE